MTQQEVITMLEALISVGRRLEAGLRRSAAAATAGEQVKCVLLRRADERAAMADELQLERDWLAGIALLGGHAAATAPADLPLPSQAFASLASNKDLLANS